MRSFPVFIFCVCLGAVPPCGTAAAQDGDAAVARPALVGLARDFVSRMNRGFRQADRVLTDTGVTPRPDTNTVAARGLADGESLIFRVILGKSKLVMDEIIAGEVQRDRIVLSLRDAVRTLGFPIEMEPEAARAAGWYIRENRKFELDTLSRTVVSAAGTFAMSPDVTLRDGDILVPLEELASWFGIGITPDLSSLDLRIESDIPLPVEEKAARRQYKFNDMRDTPPVLPRGDDAPRAVGLPMVDVSTLSRYSKDGNREKGNTNHTVNIRTAGDFAYGTLLTQTRIDEEALPDSVRVTYKKESAEPDLLGPLKARRFEAGDVLTTNLPLARNGSQELGVRITNTDPLYNFSRPTTQITGPAPAGWDVELHRDSGIIDFQTVGDDGIYVFENVDLYRSENSFRVVMYGPQGEIREESVYVPVDPRRLSDDAAYDVSLSLTNKNTYVSNDDDISRSDGAPRLAAIYEQPLSDNSAIYAGLRSEELEGVRKSYVHGGFSTGFKGALLNLDTAIDHEGEMAADFSVRRDFGKHQLRNTTSWATENFQVADIPGAGANREVFGNDFGIYGPLPDFLGNRPRYSFSADYGERADGDSRYTLNAGFNTALSRFAMGQNYIYTHDDAVPDDRLNSLSTLTGSFGKNRIRVSGNYQVKPEKTLERVAASFQHRFSKDLDLELNLEKRFRESLVEGGAQLNWMAGFARISPSVTYNNQGDVTAMLNTNFGLLREPQTGSVRSFDRNVTTAGAVSVLVFLDRDGDGLMGEGDEPLPDIIVQSLQNGGRGTTDENGIALLKNMISLRLTDITVDQKTLPDPFWVPGYEGASILPREGFIAEMQFPIHIGGEMDGTLYVRGADGAVRPLRDVTLHLYDRGGKVVRSARSGSDGFYLFDIIPPGYYMLMIDDEDARRYGLERPAPQDIVIGFEGTVIYGNNITVGSGSADVPVGFAAGINDYLAANPHIDAATLAGKKAILNLGSYRSQLLMGLVWYKARHRYAGLLGGGRLIVPPSQSYAAPQTGNHELLVEIPGLDLAGGVEKCRALAARGVACSVELVPADALRQAAAVRPAKAVN